MPCTVVAYLPMHALYHSSPTRLFTTLTTAGTEVSATVAVPKRLMDKLDNAAALGSVARSKAVAMAEELPPRVTPRVT